MTIFVDKLKIFVLGCSEEQLYNIPDAPHLIKINLNELDIGEYQNNQFAEHRMFLSDLPEKTTTEYIGFCTYRWQEKWDNLIKLEDLHTLDLLPEIVYCAYPVGNWYEDTKKCHCGIDKYVEELFEYTGLSITNRLSFIANQFICHKSVYLDWQKFFRNTMIYFHEKYKFDYNFDIYRERFNSRKASMFYELFAVLYFSNRNDLTIKKIPKGNK